MIKKLFFIIFLSSAINAVYGQGLEKNQVTNNPGLTTINQNLKIIVMIDSIKYEIDSKKFNDIKPDWIDKVDVMKDDISKRYMETRME